MVTSKEYKLIVKGGEMVFEQSIPEVLAKKIVAQTVAWNEGGNKFGLGTTSPEMAVAQAAENDDASISVKDFMLKRAPKTDLERVTCLAFYLTNYRNQREFKTRDITLINREAAQPSFSNPAAAVRNATSYGYLTLAGGGHKTITSHGETLVTTLPNRDKIKEALKQQGFKKKRQKRKTNNAT